ncbi:MAG: single-stranded DNA-binding protein [Eubacteriaceae bacterium]
MNKVVLIGRLTRDPELRYTGQGTPVATFTLAVNRKFKNKNGENEADFISIVVWGNQAENTSKYVSKGRQVAVYGRIQVRNYEAKDGTRRYVTEVVGEEVTFLSSNNNNNSNRVNESSKTEKNQDYGVPMDDFHPMEEDDDDLPF